MILDEIKGKLQELDPKVYYGMVDDEVEEMVWDYTVFNRVKPAYSQNKTSKSDYYDVHVIRENYIPEDFDEEVIAKMCEIDGMRLTNEDGAYNYIKKPNTNIVVEMLTLHFVRAKKCLKSTLPK